MMKSVVIALITICFGISIAIPIKDHDIDELVLRVNELRRLNPYQDDSRNMFYVRNLDSLGGGNLLRSLDNLQGGENLLQSSAPTNKQEFYERNNGFGGMNNAAANNGGGNRHTLSPLLQQRIIRSLDSIGGGNLIRALDSIGGGHLVKRTLDSLGGANLIRK